MVSPIDRKTIAAIPDCDTADVDRAVAGTRHAFEARSWQGMSPKQRKRILLDWADRVSAEALRLAALERRDMGMPIRLAEELEINFAIDSLRWYGEAADKLYDELAHLDDNVSAMISRTPLGVVGAILPWECAAMIGAWKLGPALVAGNSVVLKPAEDASLVCLRIVELALEAGMPQGVLQVVTGDHKVGAALAAHRCRLHHLQVGARWSQIMSSGGQFEYSSASAWSWAARAPTSSSPSTPDLAMAADISVGFMFGNQGQVCEAPTRLLVQRAIRDSFTEEVVKRTRAAHNRQSARSAHDLGPIVNAAQRTQILARMDAPRKKACASRSTAAAPRCRRPVSTWRRASPSMSIRRARWRRRKYSARC